MIAKRIDRVKQNDHFVALANYIQDAKAAHSRVADYIADQAHGGEKVLYAWHMGCEADEYDLAIKEVVVTQELNVRSKKVKTYHLIVSFRPEDEALLSEEVYQQVEMRFAQALGFDAHQRHCGVHQNTNNLHMHIAYNMIHPKKLTRHEPFQDFKTLSETCRGLEKDFGLQVDNGMESGRKSERFSSRIEAALAHSGEEPFQSFVLQQNIAPKIDEAKSWAEIHKICAQHGLEFTPRGNGAVLKDAHHKKRAIKASDVARSVSFAHIVKKLGPYEPSQLTKEQRSELESVCYTQKPMAKDAAHDPIYLEFQAVMDLKKSALAKIDEDNKAKRHEINKFFEKSANKIADLIITKKDRAELYHTSRKRHIDALTKVKDAIEISKKEIYEQHPFRNWTQFLQWQAENGNERALDLLRTAQKREQEQDKEEVAAEKEVIKDNWRNKQTEIRERSDLVRKDKSSLVAITKMRQLQELEAVDGKAALFQGMTLEINQRGTIVYKLPGAGGEIRDTGKQVFFRGGENTKEAALKYARTRWGKHIKLDGTSIEPLSKELQLALKRLAQKASDSERGM